MKYFRAIHIGDFHSGHILGLTPPNWHSEEYRAWQLPLWQFYTDMMKQFGHVDVAFLGGDLIEGPGYKESTSNLTTDVGKQAEMAVQAIDHIKADKFHVIRGTGFHTDGHTSYEDKIANALGVEAVDEYRCDIYGRLFNVRHVVGRSDTPYGQHTQNQKEMINEMLQSELEDYKSADVLLRNHVHYCTTASVGDATRGIVRHVYTAPALQLRGPKQSAFTRKLRTWLYHVGVTLIEVDPKTKEVFIRPFLMPIKNYMRREYECLTREKK